MVLGKLPVPGRPTVLITVGQGPTALAVGAGGGCLDIFTLIYPFSPLSPSLWETARYRLKYCLKGPLNPKQSTNQLNRRPGTKSPTTPILFRTIMNREECWLVGCFGLNGPLRQYFSLYRAVSQRGGETPALRVNPASSHPLPGRVAQSIWQLICKSEVLGSMPSLATYFRFSFR